MNIRQFAQLCQHAADGKDCAALLPKDPATLVAMAKAHRVLPLLATALGQKAAQAAALPQLQTPLHHTTRNMRIKAQLLALDQALEGTGQTAILLKGAVGLFDPIYRDSGARYMADIDILVRDGRFAEVLAGLGYVLKDPSYENRLDREGKPILHLGGFHLSPVIRQGDLVTMEPHLLASSPKFAHLLPTDLASDVWEVPGCRNLLLPSRTNHLIVSLIHAIKHDRDTLDGSLLIRGLLECEMLFDRLTDAERRTVEQHFAACGGQSMFRAWRALADWLFRNDDAAQRRSVAAFLLISEFRWRAKGYRAVFLISMGHRLIAPLSLRYWTNLIFVGQVRRLVQKDFWVRFFNRLGQAYRD
jgi:hypothetical protein